ncbi:MAG TPA: ABC transporter substrate-binding protein [Solirubrobacterales bacterium]|nr:ABC transporter substrate-binding protein [Solirubrobacterales bacterium]
MLVVGMAAAVLAGCGSGGEAETTASLPLEPPREIDVTLDGYSGPGTVGILMAERRGYFDDLGLDVWVRTPASRLSPVPYVVGREVALSVSHQPQVVLAKEKGAPITAFGSLVSKPTAAMIWPRGSGIGGVSDLKGKTIGFAGLPFEREFLVRILEQEGLALSDVKIITDDYYLVSTVVSGQVDAIFGAANVEGAELKALGFDPVITPVSSFGIPPYDELVLITRSDRLAKEPDAIRAFMAAVARGTAAAIEDPEAAASVIERSIGADADRSRKVNEAQVEATLPLLSRDGYLDPDQAKGLVDWMQEEGMAQQAPSVDELFTDEYLAQPDS